MACTAAKVPECCSYEGLKHSSASRWLAAGESMETVKDLLRHTSIQSTSIYAKAGEKSKVRAIRGE